MAHIRRKDKKEDEKSISTYFNFFGNFILRSVSVLIKSYTTHIHIWKSEPLRVRQVDRLKIALFLLTMYL